LIFIASPPLSPGTRRRRRIEREITNTEAKLKEALKDAITPESVFWYYKFNRRLWRLKNIITSDSVYHTETGLAFSINIQDRRIKEPLDRIIARNLIIAIGHCLTRPRDRKNS
jgi:hypothetical protein